MATPTPAPAADPIRRQILRLEAHQAQRDFTQLAVKLRKRPLVLFFGREAFADNSKYLYLRAVAGSRGYEVLWCTTSAALAERLAAHDLPCLHIGRDADRTIELFMHAAVAVFTVNPFESVGLSLPLLGCLAGAQHVQLWHGVSVKRLNLQLMPHLGTQGADIRQYWMANCAADHVLSTSSLLDAYWREVFGCRSLLRAGYPRNEVILREATVPELLGAELAPRALEALQGSAPVVLVVPTWQRGKSTELTEPTFLAHAVRFARQHRAHIFFKAHPSYFGRWDAADREIEGLHLIDPGVDIYPWMQRFDALVTDYSSILFDYLLTGRPVLTLDLDAQRHQSYEPDFGLVPPGRFRIPFRSESFGATLADALSGDDGRDERLAYAAQVFETDPLHACDSLLRVIDTLVERSQRPDHQVWQSA